MSGIRAIREKKNSESKIKERFQSAKIFGTIWESSEILEEKSGVPMKKSQINRLQNKLLNNIENNREAI
jgi:hypothetical protein